jgi:SAUR family protein
MPRPHCALRIAPPDAGVTFKVSRYSAPCTSYARTARLHLHTPKTTRRRERWGQSLQISANPMPSDAAIYMATPRLAQFRTKANAIFPPKSNRPRANHSPVRSRAPIQLAHDVGKSVPVPLYPSRRTTPPSMCKVAITIPSLVWLCRAVRRWRSRGRAADASRSTTTCFSSPRPCTSVPAGHVAVCVEAAAAAAAGSGSTRRFVVRVAHLSHPSFRELLRQAEEEYGFPAAPGPIALPCDEDHFRDVLHRVSTSAASSSSCSCCGLATRRCARGESGPLLQGRIMAVDQKLGW